MDSLIPAGMENLHPLLRRQWQRYFGREQPTAETLGAFLNAVSNAYAEFDTARRMVERALALSSSELHAANSELRGVLQVLPDVLFRVGADNQISGVMQGSSVKTHPAVRAFDRAAAAESGANPAPFVIAVEQVRQQRSPVAFEYTDGEGAEAKHYEVRLLPFVEHDILGVMRDITERKRAETALRESEERLALAQRAGHVGAFDWDLRTGRVYWNAESEDIFGVERGRAEQNYDVWLQRVVPEDRARLERFLREWLESTRDQEQWEYRIQLPDRRERFIESKAYAFRDASGKAHRVTGTNLDITARKQAEQDRLVLGKLESTGILAGGIAHDFNNLLTSILLNVEMAQSFAVSRQQLAGYLAETRRNVLAAQVLTQQLITFARGGSGTRRTTQLAARLGESVSLALSGSNVRSELVIAPELWSVAIDVGQISQVIRNLVLNAREAMPSGGVVTVRAQNVTLGETNEAALPAGNYVHLQFEDRGSGIAADVLPKIFDPYFSTKTRGEQKGMGLGLTICHSIILKHAGAITVNSSPGGPTCFHVYLPACEKPPVTETKPAAAPTEARVQLGRVLVMDDEPSVRMIFEHVLRLLGYEPATAENGEKALEAYQQAKKEGRPFDVVILDLTVRGEMGGQEVARVLLEQDPSVRAIVMSGYGEDDVMRRYQEFGFKGTLIKPFDSETLRAMLARVMAG
jgi:two-component system, cell cycle sensor histidine kinase and response regulator CckA